MVVSNLYPFRESPDIETIDIGGPAMTRAAAKNHAWVAIVTSPGQYDGVLAELREHGALGDDTRRALALEAFARTAAYDAAIVAWLQRDEPLPRPPRARARTHRRDAALRREPAPAGRALPRRGHDELVGRRGRSTAGSRSRTSTTTTPTPRGACVHDLRR